MVLFQAILIGVALLSIANCAPQFITSFNPTFTRPITGPAVALPQAAVVSQAPFATFGHAPVATVAHAPVATVAHAPVATVAHAPIATLAHAPVATVPKVEEVDPHPRTASATMLMIPLQEMLKVNQKEIR